MADIDILPQDIVDELKASGVKFDENGNIIEDKLIETNDDDQDDDQQDTDDQEDNDDSSDDEDDDSDEGSDNDETSDDGEDDTNDDDESKSKSKSKKSVKTSISLTKRKVGGDGKDTIENLRREKAELESRLEALLKDDEAKPEDSIKKEALRFKHMRMQEFKNSVVRSVNDLSLGASFQEIIASEEWQSYLGTKVFGVKVSDMLKNAIEETSLDDVVSFYSDFVNRYVPSVAKVKPSSKTAKKLINSDRSKKLADLATPDRTVADKKAVTKNSSRNTFIYNETDYETMLGKAERGQISYEDFVKFEAKFDAAKKAGRVKMSV